MPTIPGKKFAELILYISDRSELDPYFKGYQLFTSSGTNPSAQAFNNCPLSQPRRQHDLHLHVPQALTPKHPVTPLELMNKCTTTCLY